MSHINTYPRWIENCIPTFNHMQHKYIPLFMLEHKSWQLCTWLSSLNHFLFVYSSFQSRVTSCQRRAQTDHKKFSNRNYTSSVPYSFRIYRYHVHVNACSLKARLHRRFLLRFFSFWCMRLNGLTYEYIRPSVAKLYKSILLWFNHSIACVRMRKIAAKIARVNGP